MAYSSMLERDRRTKERIAQSKWARAGSLAIVDYNSVVCRCYFVFIFFVCFVLFCFCLFTFTKAAALRSIVLRYMCDYTCMRPDSHTQLPNNCLRPFLLSFLFVSFFVWICRFFRVYCTNTVFSLYGEYVACFSLSGGCFLLGDDGLNFLHQLM